MINQLDYLSAFYLIGIAQSLFLFIALLDARIGNRSANRYLALFLLLFSLSLLDEFLYQSRLFYDLPGLIGLYWPLEFLFGPLFYLYVVKLTSRQAVWVANRDSLHFVIFPLAIMLELPLLLQDPEQKLLLLYGSGMPTVEAVLASIPSGLAGMVVSAQLAVYIGMSFYRLYRHRRNIIQQFSSIEKIELAWLQRLLIIATGLWIVYALDIWFGHGDTLGQGLHILLVITIFTLGYAGMRQGQIFQESAVELAEDKSTPHSSMDRVKYKKSRLHKDRMEKIRQCLQRCMTEQRVYLENDLNLTDLAGRLECSNNELSQVINDQFGQNFFDYINAHRIAEAKRLLCAPEHDKTPVLTIAMESGFNSKSAFYTAFKKDMGISPTAYRRQKKQQ